MLVVALIFKRQSCTRGLFNVEAEVSVVVFLAGVEMPGCGYEEEIPDSKVLKDLIERQL